MQQIYHEIGLHKLCKEISQKYKFDFTDAIHEAFNFRTDYQIVTNNVMKKIQKIRKEINITQFRTEK